MTGPGGQAAVLAAASDMLATLPDGWGEQLHVTIIGHELWLRPWQSPARGPGGPDGADWTSWLVRVAATRPHRAEVRAEPRAVMEGRHAVDLAVTWRHRWRGTEIGVTALDQLHELDRSAGRADADRRALDAAARFRAAVAAVRERARPGPVGGQPDLFAGAA